MLPRARSFTFFFLLLQFLHFSNISGLLAEVSCGQHGERVSRCWVAPTMRNREDASSKIGSSKLILSWWKFSFSCLLAAAPRLQQHRHRPRSGCNLIVSLLLLGPRPSARTCFKRSPLAADCYFSFRRALGFFNHMSVTKQTNKFRACAADTNIDVSYEIERARERLWCLMLNICRRRAAHPSAKSHCLLSPEVDRSRTNAELLQLGFIFTRHTWSQIST